MLLHLFSHDLSLCSSARLPSTFRNISFTPMRAPLPNILSFVSDRSSLYLINTYLFYIGQSGSVSFLWLPYKASTNSVAQINTDLLSWQFWRLEVRNQGVRRAILFSRESREESFLLSLDTGSCQLSFFTAMNFTAASLQSLLPSSHSLLLCVSMFKFPRLCIGAYLIQYGLDWS